MSDRDFTDLEYVSTSPDATEAVGRVLGRAATGGELLALIGSLGAGKTTLVRGLARGLDVDEDEPVTSPTFVLEAEYEGRLRLLHMDAYRLENANQFEMLGALPEGAERCESLVAVEWSDRVSAALPEDRLELIMTHVSPEERRLRFRAAGVLAQAWLAACGALLDEVEGLKKVVP